MNDPSSVASLLSHRATVVASPTPGHSAPHFTRRTVAWTLTLGALRVGLRRSEWRERWEGRAA